MSARSATNINKLGVTPPLFSTKSNISQEPSIKHRLIIPIDQGLVTPDVQVMTFLQSRSDLTSKNGLENPNFLGCTLSLSDAHHIYLVNHLIKKGCNTYLLR